MTEQFVTQPLFIPKWIDGNRYWTEFEKVISKLFWPAATANEALVLGLVLIGILIFFFVRKR